MSNYITEKKKEEMFKIYNNYENYKGKTKSKLEKEIETLKNKLPQEEYDNLQTAFKAYKSFIINIFANTRKIKVYFEEQPEENTFTILEDLEDLD